MSAQPSSQNSAPEADNETSVGMNADFFLTYFLLAVLVIIHVYQMNLDDPYTFVAKYAINNTAIASGEYYRLFTAMFLHADLTHLIMNSLGLYFFGQAVEQLFGKARYLFIYLLGGLAGSIMSFMITDGLSIGASGAVLALFGAVAAYYIVNRKLHGKAAAERLRSLAVVAAINLLIGFASNAPGSTVRIDNAAHIGGALGGLILGLLVSPIYALRHAITAGGQFQNYLVDVGHPWRWSIYVAAFAVVLGLLFLMGLS